jgi:pimeloyl-ACP methyl ester carboxylesterase
MDFDSDGVRLHYTLHGPEAREPVVLVHGFASDYELNWVGSRWQEALERAGYRVIGLDCRGHGQSSKPHDPAAYALATMAADVRNLLDELEIPSTRYIGYSMGARIGLRALLDFPDRIRCAVLGGVGMSGALEDAEKIAHALRGSPPENEVAATFQRFAAARPSNDLEALAACIVGQQPGLDPERLRAIRTPILVVVGERDDIARNTQQLVGQIPDARLVVIPGRDHMSVLTARPFKDAALEFLAEN